MCWVASASIRACSTRARPSRMTSRSPPARSASSRSAMADWARGIVRTAWCEPWREHTELHAMAPRLASQQAKDLPSKSTTSRDAYAALADLVDLATFRDNLDHALQQLVGEEHNTGAL